VTSSLKKAATTPQVSRPWKARARNPFLGKPDTPPGVTPDWESYAGCNDATWYVCFTPTLTVKWWTPPGEVTYSPRPGYETCVPVKASYRGGGSRGTLLVAIDGKAEDDDLTCTIKGRTTVTLFVGYKCKGELHRGVLEISFKQKWGQAPATLSCTPKREGVHVLPDSIITLGTLGEQEDKMELKLQLGDAGECQTYPIPAGPITGSLVYCLWSHTSYQPPALPEPP